MISALNIKPVRLAVGVIILSMITLGYYSCNKEEDGDNQDPTGSGTFEYLGKNYSVT